MKKISGFGLLPQNNVLIIANIEIRYHRSCGVFSKSGICIQRTYELLIALIFSTLYSKIAFQGSTWNPVGSLGVPRGSLGFLRGVNDSWWFLVGFL